MKKRALKHTGDAVIYTGRFNPLQVRNVSTSGTDADFSHTDGGNLEAVKPKKGSRSKVKTVIENTKPEL